MSPAFTPIVYLGIGIAAWAIFQGTKYLERVVEIVVDRTIHKSKRAVKSNRNEVQKKAQLVIQAREMLEASSRW